MAAHFKKGDTILDVGAGTGNMALSLTHLGFNVTALEPGESMAELIRSKTQTHQFPIHVTTKTMQQLNQLEENYQGIYCIGNTLAHLQDLEEIQAFFQQTYEKLQPGGIFIIQIVNFEKQNIVFPTIQTEHFLFKRQYEQNGSHILFTTTLTTKDDFQKNTIPLYPATVAQLSPLLEACGFDSITAYGNFAMKNYEQDDPALIIVAKKKK